ncbi:MAG TPA: heavy metal-binding domain-containing protein [Vicinamibacterales bacterium]|nr:heavy metal-binding domain-containing protein [Vicinamibacterales bacterium]
MRNLTLALVIALTAVAAAQKKQDLPPMSYVCTMMGDEDVVEDKPGKCPKCGMTLVPIRLVSVFTCGSKPGLAVQDTPGKCPVDGTPLERMTMSVKWTCPGVSTAALSPGVCRDGTPMKPTYELRPHGNHNPQHGGQFFMAPDNWHHLEGTYPRAGTFRMYLYDDFTRPLARAKAKDVQGHVIVRGQTYPLTLAPNGRYLEAKLDGVNLPAAVEANVKFAPDGKANVFDFSFDSFSKEPTAAAVTTSAAGGRTAAPATAPAAAPAKPAAAATPSPSTAPTVDAALAQVPVPDTVPEMLQQLKARTDQIRMLIDRGLFADVYVPAFQAKDVAIALEAHQRELPAAKREVSEPAIAKLVRAAYMLDAFGDLGNKQQISAAYDQFAAASKDIQSAFPQ